MRLTDTKCRSFKAKDKPYKESDGAGLYLLIKPNSRKYWRMNYRYSDKAKTLAIGVYPDISLKEARNRRNEARKLLDEGKDPSFEKQRDKLRQQIAVDNQFFIIAAEWLSKKQKTISKIYHGQLTTILEKDINPVIGKMPINEITAPELLLALRKIEERGAFDTVRKARQCCGQIFRYAIAIGKAERDIAQDLKGALEPYESKNHAYLEESELPEFFERLSCFDGNPITIAAIELLMLTFVRTQEIRFAVWTEFDLKKKHWRIPPERMKNKKQHIVPLSSQAVDVLKRIKALTGERKFLFQNSNVPVQPISENTMLYAIYRMGYHGRATIHGFRSTASTILHENRFNSDVIERQLAHVERNKIKAAYNHAQHLEERTEMMQWWADHLDTFRPKK